jgi:hypothetical protein
MARIATIEICNSDIKHFFRSGKGGRVHASYACIASRRSIWWGEVQALTVSEAVSEGWTGCGHCCTPADHALLVPAAPVAKVENCKNEGIKHPGQRRIYSACSTCGKEGKVNRSTGRIRAHAAK